jgi:hypothetical protein
LRPGRGVIRRLVVRMARENPGWAIGVSRASRLGHHIASSTVWRILQAAGIDPASRRAGPTWTHFLTQQAKAVLAVDLVHIDTVVLRRIYALIVVEHGWRRVHLAGITAHPSGAWTDSTPADRTGPWHNSRQLRSRLGHHTGVADITRCVSALPCAGKDRFRRADTIGRYGAVRRICRLCPQGRRGAARARPSLGYL